MWTVHFLCHMIQWDKIVLEELIVAYSPHIMEPRLSLPYSQQSSTGPYPEIAVSSLHLYNLIHEIKFYVSFIITKLVNGLIH
jgi:hypothetical protein